MHDLDLQQFAPLRPLQVFYLVRALHRPELAGRGDVADVWNAVALHVNANCAELPSIDPDVLRTVALRNTSAFRTPMHKYSLWAQVFADPWFTFMNYGYRAFAPSELDLVGTERYWEHAAAMYHLVASQVPLAGKDVLEIGCGRGGGAAYVARRFATRSYVASDATASNVLACKTHPGITALHARAEDLPLPDASVDAVINVESCKYYAPFEAFASEVMRVVRRDGHLLIAFYDALDGALAIERKLAAAGLVLERRHDITANVIAAMMEFRHVRLFALLDACATADTRRHYHELLDAAFAIDAFTSGRSRYYCAAWRRP